jgi:hypothetical protein
MSLLAAETVVVTAAVEAAEAEVVLVAEQPAQAIVSAAAIPSAMNFLFMENPPLSVRKFRVVCVVI